MGIPNDRLWLSVGGVEACMQSPEVQNKEAARLAGGREDRESMKGSVNLLSNGRRRSWDVELEGLLNDVEQRVSLMVKAEAALPYRVPYYSSRYLWVLKLPSGGALHR